MTEVTLEQVQAKQAELAALIARLAEPKTTTLQLPATTIVLQPGEHYAGARLNADGTIASHLVLMAAKPAGTLAWQEAMDWAASVGGELPSRAEMALLYANCRDHVDPEWHWSRETHASDASFAWICLFGDGLVSYTLKSFEGRARAVRRFNP
ncbi:MAG: DUF1566 domain-containing protein [Burkholderiaceae bacterium]|nr:DUF1566 domain-containing protein [Burkholderiaceae bacterium]